MERIGKKTSGVFLLSALFSGLLLLFGSTAWAGYDGCALANPEDSFPTIDPQAKGQKYTGPLTIYFEVIPDSPGTSNCIVVIGAGAQTVNLHMQTRLRKGTEVVAVGSTVLDLCYDDTGSHATAVQEELLDTVFLEALGTNQFATSATLKTFDDFSQDSSGDGGSPADPYFLIVDWTIAVLDF